MGTHLWVLALLVVLCALGVVSADETKETKSTDADEDMIAHIVYFTLKDNSAEARKKLVDACDKYLTKHDGTVFYSTGIRAADLDRKVNDRDFDVGLHVIFKNKAAHDKYQEHPRHLEFIEKNKDNWKQVRVFDTRISNKK